MRNLLTTTLFILTGLLAVNTLAGDPNESEPGIVDGVGTVNPSGTPAKPNFVINMDKDPMLRDYWAGGPKIWSRIKPFLGKKIQLRARIEPATKNPKNRMITEILSIEEVE